MKLLSVFTVTAALVCAVIPVTRGAEHQVTVGGIGVLKFDPEFINAAPGDTVFFTFKQKNHTVTQSTLQSPCSPLPDGINSGFVPVPDTQTDNFQQAKFTIESNDPIWVYCRQANHCQQGMVFAVNPGDKFDTFKANAIANTTTPPPATTSATQKATSTATGTGAAAPTGSATTHVITVGGNGALTFDPSNISAQVGDKVSFKFAAKNHTATQSTFANPCEPLGETSANGQVGFDSGFMPVQADAAEFPVFDVIVNDTAPVWVYCRQANHCQQGMVFAINAPASGNTFDAFLQKAKGSGTPSAPAAPSSTSSSGSPNGARGTLSGVHGGSVLFAIFAVVLGSLL